MVYELRTGLTATRTHCRKVDGGGSSVRSIAQPFAPAETRAGGRIPCRDKEKGRHLGPLVRPEEVTSVLNRCVTPFYHEQHKFLDTLLSGNANESNGDCVVADRRSA